MAAYSKVSICNLALAMVGSDPIRDFSEANKRSRMCDVFYETTRDLVLSRFDWPFAREYKKLNALALPDDEQLPGLIAYALPSDCLTPTALHPFSTRNKWTVFGNKLFTDQTEPRLFYTKQNVSINLFSEAFVNILSLNLALRLAPPITQDKDLVRALQELKTIEENTSWAVDANIGNFYKEYDDVPELDPFVNPDLAPGY